MRAVFRHTAGSKKGQVEAFDLPRIRLGRDPGNDLTFDPYLDRDASGHHAEVYEEEGKAWLRDTGSTNGTYVNGEKVLQKALEIGDVIWFGRNGPKLEYLGSSEAGPPAEGEPEGEKGVEAKKGGGGRGMGVSTVQAIVKEAIQKERGRGAGSKGTAVMIKEAVQEAVRESRRRGRLLLALVVLGFAGVLAAGIAVLATQTARIREQEDRITRSEEAVEDAKRTAKGAEELLLEFREQFRDQFFTAQQEQAERQRQREESQDRIARLEARIASLSPGTEALEALRRELHVAKNERAVFQEIEKASEPAILLIYTAFAARSPEGKERTFKGFGTGFIATPEGHVITNKHVVQPWKFAKIKRILERENLERDPEKDEIAAWRAGSRVYQKSAGAWLLNLNAGYNTRVLKNLEVFTTAPDHMDWVNLGDRGDEDEGETQRVYAHAHDNSDLAVLKISDRFAEFQPVRLATEEAMKGLRKLDAVLSVGFPRGGSLLEQGIAEPSASRGDIRKFETSILISAPIIGGNSGGPVFDETGAVIGVCTRTVRGAESFGFCIPIRCAIELLPPEYR